MKPMTTQIRYYLFPVFLALAIMVFAVSVHAQTLPGQATSELLITWQVARSYVPPSYLGKALPNLSSPITASVEAFTGAARGNLSNVTVYWYLNDVLLGGGPGVRTMTFNVMGGGGSQTLRVEATDYPGGLLTSSVTIPPVNPTVVIEAPYSGGFFSANPLLVAAVPYFFAVTSPSQLGFTWTVNGETAGNVENPDRLQVTLAPGTQSGSTISISVAAANAGDGTSATDQKMLTYQALP
jgi:hypothetical protein